MLKQNLNNFEKYTTSEYINSNFLNESIDLTEKNINNLNVTEIKNFKLENVTENYQNTFSISNTSKIDISTENTNQNIGQNYTEQTGATLHVLFNKFLI